MHAGNAMSGRWRWRASGSSSRTSIVPSGTSLMGSESGSASAVCSSVPPVLDGVIRTAVEMAGNLGPLFAVLCHQLLNVDALLLGNGAVVERGLEVLVVSFSALFGRARAENLRDAHPVGGAMVVYEREKTEVFFRAPGASASGPELVYGNEQYGE